MRWRVLPVALYCVALLDQQPDRFHWLITIRLPLLFTDLLSKLSARQPRECLVQLCYAAISETLQLPTAVKALRNQCSPALWLQEEPLKAWFPEPIVLLASLLAGAVNRPGKPSLTSSPEAAHLLAGRFINVTFRYNCLYLQTRGPWYFFMTSVTWSLGIPIRSPICIEEETLGKGKRQTEIGVLSL